MARLAIEAAPDAAALTGAELIPLLQNGSPAKTTPTAMATFAGSSVGFYATQQGMVGDDSTDNSAKFTQVLNALSSMGGGKFVFDYDRRQTATCVYRLGSPHVIPTNVEIEGQNGVAIRINHNAGVGLDFKGIFGNRSQHQVLRRLKIYDGGSRTGTDALVRFQQAARFFITDCFFDNTYNSLAWLETESGHIANTTFWECEGVDWSIANSIDVWVYATQHLGKQDPTPDPPPGDPYVPYTPSQLGTGVSVTNGVSGLKAFGWAIGRKHRGIFFGDRIGVLDAPLWVTGTDYALNDTILTSAGRHYLCSTDPGAAPSTIQPTHALDEVIEADGYGWTFVAAGKTPEHVDIFGLVVDNCRDVGVEISGLFNANFYGYFISSCGLIDGALGDPNGERRVGILISATRHPQMPTKTSTQTVRFHRGGWVALNRREGLVIQGVVASGHTMTPTDIDIHAEFGSNNRAETAGIGHVLVDGGDVNGINFDGVVFKAAELKILLTATPNSEQCIKFNGDLTNEDIRLTNMTLGDTSGAARMSGDISLNDGVVIANNNELFFTDWVPVLNFGGSTSGVGGTFFGTKSSTNGLMTLEFKVTLTGTGSGAATITGVPQASLNDVVGDLKVLSGGVGIPAGVYCRISDSTIYLEYQGATGSAALNDTHLTSGVNFVGSISYAMDRP